GGQTGTARMLIWIVARGIALIRPGWCHPELVLAKSRSLHEAGIFAGERQDVRARHQFVANWFAIGGVVHVRIDDPPGALRLLIFVAHCLLFGSEHPALDLKRIAVSRLFVYEDRLRF